jgi:LPXTG-motif cell wall-anchored protein
MAAADTLIAAVLPSELMRDFAPPAAAALAILLAFLFWRRRKK